MKKLNGYACVLILSLLCCTYASAQCKTTEAGMVGGYQSNLNSEIDAYGRIFMDADDPACSQNALYSLYDKITSTLSQPKGFQEWLDGYKVALAFAAAQRIGANGWASRDLDFKLQDVEARFVVVSDKPTMPDPTPCGNENLGSCMDSDSGAAAAYAWMAAYDYRRGRSASNNVSQATTYLHSSMADTCIVNVSTFYAYPYNGRVLCNGTVAELASGSAVTMSFNHLVEDIPYGFGLMTGVASAILGLNAAGVSYSWSESERTIANALFEEAERHVNSAGNFMTDCARPVKQADGTWGGAFDAACGDATLGYTPDVYALQRFYLSQFMTYPQVAGTTYRSAYPGGTFHLGPNDPAQSCGTEFCFSFGRYVTYQTIAYGWFVTPREYMPFNNYPPIGAFDLISPTGAAQGWACDNDKPTGRVVVDLYDEYGHKAQGFADLSSESAVNERCWGGTAHRFWIQLPSNMSGTNITAYALDYTWIGYTQLACNQQPRCSF
jgi:hypothetical protein